MNQVKMQLELLEMQVNTLIVSSLIAIIFSFIVGYLLGRRNDSNSLR